VIQYNNFWQGLVTLVPGSRMTMEFGTDGRLSGNSGCNSFFGSYRAGGNTISISEFGSTSMFCAEPEGVMQQEAEFLAILPNAASFRLDGDRLDLRDADDQFIAILNRIR
jgi:heat shock protein HslJ